MQAATTSRAPLGVWLAELFAVFNLAFLAVDVYVAHSVNAFREQAEWIPVGFSVVAPLLLVPGLFRRAGAGLRSVGFGVGAASVVVGLVGLILHLESSFFEQQTLHSLLYSAPFVAPLAYSGVGLVLLLNRMEPLGGQEWARWIVLLGLSGFVGNFALSLLDHAQNGFFESTEWIPVGAAAYATSFLLIASVQPRNRALLNASIFVMGVQCFVGVVGFVLHVQADLGRPGATLWDQVVFGAPPFAPLLFPNLAILSVLGLWQLRRLATR